MEKISSNKIFNGSQEFWKHQSSSTKTEMTFSIYLPENPSGEKLPVLYWLSGLTCTAENFTTKAGAQKYASEENIIIVCPDTSPRGAGVEGEDERYDLGSGAGFYVNATQEKWAKHYHMYTYVTEELPKLIAENFPVDASRESVFGHSMGGHGALICGFKNPGRYKSVSAFAPICAPSECDWGKLALSEYLGEDKSTWAEYDAAQLVTSGYDGELLIDQGMDDQFLVQLNFDLFAEACEKAGVSLNLRKHDGYDHSYYFIASFVEDHIRWHSKQLKA